ERRKKDYDNGTTSGKPEGNGKSSQESQEVGREVVINAYH
ncbi:unnamed protein product, partial [marine sediment metagenome]